MGSVEDVFGLFTGSLSAIHVSFFEMLTALSSDGWVKE